nr:MAG TPA: hypothetical protein [Caudoviricetes sp.]
MRNVQNAQNTARFFYAALYCCCSAVVLTL